MSWKRSRLDATERIEPDRLEAISFRVRLAVFAMFGQALIGDAMSLVTGEERQAERRRFRQWFSDLMLESVAGTRKDSASD